MSVSVSYVSQLTVTEALETNVGDLSDKSITHSGYNSAASSNAASVPPASKVAAGQVNMIAGAGSIDLTALALGAQGTVVDMTGMRVQFIKVKALAGNANPITISKSVANGYDGFGASFSLSLAPGGEMLLRGNDGGNDVAAGNKGLTLAGTGTQGIALEVVAG